VRFLLDANLSPTIRAGLGEAGHEVIHVGDVGLIQASDAEIMEYAATESLVILTADSDFAAMLAIAGALRPSVVQLRGVAELGPAAHLQLLVENLPAVAEDLDDGAVVSLSPSRLAVRRLPIR
jgi:predicted nuclease of predicted toxin-antitoxin system